jgi:hypothetical protein
MLFLHLQGGAFVLTRVHGSNLLACGLLDVRGMLGGIRVFPRLRVRNGQGGSTDEICGPEGIELLWRSFSQSEDHFDDDWNGDGDGLSIEGFGARTVRVTQILPIGRSRPLCVSMLSIVQKRHRHMIIMFVWRIPCHVSYD